MERILNYTLLENGVTPSEPVLAGVQGEHRATALVIAPNQEVANAFSGYKNAVVLIDSVTAAGEFIKGEERSFAEISKPFYLTSALTVSGLDAVILVRIVLKEENNLKELYKAQIKVCFEQAPFMPDVVFEGKTQGEILSEKAEEVCALIDERAQRAQEIINYKLETVREETTRAANQLKGANQTVAEAAEKIAEAKQTLENIEQSASKCNEIENQIEKFILVAEGCKNSALSSAQKAVENRTVAENIKADCQYISLTVRNNMITSGVNANTADRAATNAKRSEDAAKQSLLSCDETAEQIEKFVLLAEESKNSAVIAAKQSADSQKEVQRLKTECQAFEKTAKECLENANQSAASAELAAQTAKQSESVALKIESNLKHYEEDLSTGFSGLKQEVSNAFVGTVEGNNLILDDVSPLFHKLEIKILSDVGADLTKEKVTVSGKNLFSFKDYIAYVNSGIGSYGCEDSRYLEEECFSFVPYKNAGANMYQNITFKEKTQYTISFEVAMDHKTEEYISIPCFRIIYSDGSYSDVRASINKEYFMRLRFTTLPNKTIVGIEMPSYSSEATIYIKKNMQIEEGQEATDYDEYVEPQEFYADAGGRVDGVLNISRRMYISSRQGNGLEVKYNRDINKVIKKLSFEILKLGGDIDIYV